MTVLLADGDEAELDGTRRFLLLHGYDVKIAAGGVDCLYQLRRLTNAVLVLDIDLPWGGGDGVLALLQDDPTLEDTPVILTTSRTSAELPPPLAAGTVQLVLPKPLVLEGLLDVLRQLRPWPASGSPGDAECQAS
jgi:two-component system response regulator MprA